MLASEQKGTLASLTCSDSFNTHSYFIQRKPRAESSTHLLLHTYQQIVTELTGKQKQSTCLASETELQASTTSILNLQLSEGA